MTSKETMLERGRALITALRKQSDRCTFAFQQYGRPNTEQDNILKSVLRDWQRWADAARHEVIDLAREVSKEDLDFVASQVELLRPPPPARMDLRLHLWLDDGVDVNLSRSEPPKKTFGDGLDSFL